MAFWMTVLISLGVALLYSRRGLYEGLVLAFNLNLSVYLALYLTPTLVTRVPTATDIPGGLSLAVLLLFSLCLGILCVVSFFLFTGQYSVRLARVLDWLGGGIAGGFTGFLGASFFILILTLTPMPGVPQWLQDMDVTTNAQIVCSTSDTTHRSIGADSFEASELLAWLREKAQETQSYAPVDPNSDPNKAPDA